MKPREAGFSLLEILVSLTLLGIVLLGVAQLNFTLARRFAGLSGGAARDAIIAQQVNQFAALPFDSLEGRAGTTTVTKSRLPHTRTITVDKIGRKLRRVTIVIQPTDAAVRADTAVVERTKPAPNPFKKP